MVSLSRTREASLLYCDPQRLIPTSGGHGRRATSTSELLEQLNPAIDRKAHLHVQSVADRFLYARVSVERVGAGTSRVRVA